MLTPTVSSTNLTSLVTNVATGATGSQAVSQLLSGTATTTPLPLDKVVTSSVASSGGFLSGIKNIALAPFRGLQNLFSSSKPAATATAGEVTASAQSNTVGAISSTTSTATTGAAASKSGLKEMIDEVLPKAEPVSAKLLGKRVLAGVVFGVVGNGLKGAYYMATGQWSGGQAWQYMLRDTIKGAIGGGAFGLGLGLTTMALTPLGVAGIPLIIAGMVGGSALSLGSLQLLAQYDGWDWGYV